jgi:hypothetical protein
MARTELTMMSLGGQPKPTTLDLVDADGQCITTPASGGCCMP